MLPELHDRNLAEVHKCHKDIEKVQLLARWTVFWTGIDADIADYVKRSSICTQPKAMQEKQPMLPRDGPWQDLTTDIFTFQAKKTLSSVLHSVNTHSYSNPLQRPQKPYEVSTVYFLKCRPPKWLFRDSWPHVLQIPLHDTWHITSSLLYPKSNGFIAR